MARLELVLTAPALPMLAVAAVIFLVGCIALARERLSPVTIAFFALTFSGTIWLACTAMQMMAPSAAAAESWARVIYTGICALPAAVLQFTLALAGEHRARRRILTGAWTAAAIFAGLFWFAPRFIEGVWRYSWGYYTHLGAGSVSFLLFFVALLCASLVALRLALRRELSEQERKRNRSFSVALAVGYIASIDFLPSFGVDFVPVGYLAAFACILLLARAIWRFRFADLTTSNLGEHLLDSVQGGVIVVNMQGMIRLANGAAAELLGVTTHELTGQDLCQMLRLRKLPVSDSPTFASVGRKRNQTMSWKRRDGHSVDLSVSATLLRDREQLPIGILYVLNDLAERRRAERHEFDANHDALTGLPNRAYFARRFEELSADIAARARSAAVLFVDLDGFKDINDQHGHAAGDRLLQMVASRLRNAIRDDDVLARHGGDEFVALVSLRGAEDGDIVADKLVRVLRREPFRVDQLTVHVSASVGVAISPRAGADIDAVIRAADEAMYRNKRERKGQTTAIRSGERGQDRVAASPFQIESRA